MQGVERMKAVVRTGIDHWHQIQRWATQCSTTSSAWCQDSRIEIQLQEDVEPNWDAWDSLWQTTIEL
jgi:hypothetical protein